MGKKSRSNKKKNSPNVSPKRISSTKNIKLSNISTTKNNDGNKSNKYNDLLLIAEFLSHDEACSELIDCARHGEYNAVRALLEIWNSGKIVKVKSNSISPIVDTLDSSGATPLHCASANGHVSVVQLLLDNGASYTRNFNGNTPLHWAAANGKNDVVQILLAHLPFNLQESTSEGLINNGQIDVLEKNEFGRSVLTEGFSSGDTKLVGMLLEHSSAEEDRLLGCLPTEEKENTNNPEVKQGNYISAEKCDKVQKKNTSNEGKTHEFNFFRYPSHYDLIRKSESPHQSENKTVEDLMKELTLVTKKNLNITTTVLSQELPIINADNPFDDKDPSRDTTGLAIWCSSIVCARWVSSLAVRGKFHGKTVLELGAGCGLPGLAVGLYGGPMVKSVCLTDLNENTVNNLRHNVAINDPVCRKSCVRERYQRLWNEQITVLCMNWEDESTWPSQRVDFIIGSDLVYQQHIGTLVEKVVNGLLKENGTFLYVCPEEGRAGLKNFLNNMTGSRNKIESTKNMISRQESSKFQCVRSEVAPSVYKFNPLHNGDDNDAFLHFFELPVTNYILYEFCRC